MKSLALLSPYPAQGKTTIAVNLAAGLARTGNRTFLVEAGDPTLLKMWFDYMGNSLPYQVKISTDMGFDMLITPVSNISTADFNEYDFLIIDTGEDLPGHLEMLGNIDLIAACTDLRAEDADSLPALDQTITRAIARQHAIDLVIPTIINTKEWSHNSEVLFLLMDYFGEERIADMVPE
ncbi:hypothetical protein ASZ90_018099 [hydrocarbon metagenome]|uniref:CobQ/CobB/MinD/ParA nucleotide binding domain-containing protein n=1 Tax=hydrocarbon metagenome TaxID=938273 RepID=A0A0W8E7B5_9ZZZZ